MWQSTKKYMVHSYKHSACSFRIIWRKKTFQDYYHYHCYQWHMQYLSAHITLYYWGYDMNIYMLVWMCGNYMHIHWETLWGWLQPDNWQKVSMDLFYLEVYWISLLPLLRQGSWNQLRYWGWVRHFDCLCHLIGALPLSSFSFNDFSPSETRERSYDPDWDCTLEKQYY